MEFTDREIPCVDCKKPFIFTAGEQEFFDRKGFKDTPKRCKACRDVRKVRHGEGSRQVGEGVSAPKRQRGARAPGDLFEAVCASCGKPAKVPFRPTAGRPVYCSDCFGKAT